MDERDRVRARLERLLEPPRRRERVVLEARSDTAPPPPVVVGEGARLVARRLAGLVSAPEPTTTATTTTSTSTTRSAASPALRSKLEALRRSVGLETEAVTPVAERRALPGLRVRETRSGGAPLLELVRDADDRYGDRELGAVLGRTGRLAALVAGEAALAGFDVRRALFLDIETTGLAIGMGTLAFLVGAAHFRGDRLVLEQWFLRDPDDEPAVLEDLADRIAEHDHLVTFNGRTFDVPVLRARFLVHKLGDPTADLLGHLDLLTASRRLLRHALPNCRLATIEPRVLGVFRHGDVSGAEVPARYHAWLRDGEPGPIMPVVHHNRDDVLSMVTLLDELLHRAAAPDATLLRDPPCALALGRQALRIGALDDAERIFTLALQIGETAEAARRGLKRVARARR